MLKNYTFTIIICLLFQTSMFAQTPCEFNSGAGMDMAGIYPCKDYDLMSNIPVSVLATTLGNEESSDIWGWTDPLNGKEYAIVGMTNSTAFVDVSDPINPIFLGRIETANGNTSFWRDVKVYNNHAFIVADLLGDHGVQIFDLTVLRNGPNADLTYTSAANDGNVLRFQGDNGITIGSCHNIVINESEGIAYLVGCGGAASGGPVFLDISTPLSPTIVGSYAGKGYTHDAQVVTYNGPDTEHVGKQIFIGSNGNSDRVVILDVTDKSNVVAINEFDYPQIAYAHQGWFTDDHRYFILGDEVDEQSFGNNTRTLIFDFQDLDADFNTNTALTTTYLGPTAAIDHNGYVKDDKFYLANYRAGMRVLDVPTLISSNNSASEIGYFDTFPTSDSASFNGAWSVYPYFNSGNIIISDIERGLFIVRKSNTLDTPSFEFSNSFTLSPNPTTSNTTIKASENIKVNTIEIYNILGQNVFTANNINKQEYVLPVKNYRSGMYLIKINGAVTKKLIIE
ncbi:choice-of-anchor B family protein [uncultured Lacinutrix sp.]|uniref:choice-of-anchor B family protein n=1 Tax=uncultured Lacinutrix sp. TaxID=574032 RepID=UPI00262147E0|nr:choice-of-anchor B family protein [uncultured Lacinutrix sp.]